MRGELQRRLTRLSARERALLEQLRVGRSIQDVVQDDRADVAAVRGQLADIQRKLEVASGLAAVAVLVRATEPPD